MYQYVEVLLTILGKWFQYIPTHVGMYGLYTNMCNMCKHVRYIKHMYSCTGYVPRYVPGMYRVYTKYILNTYKYVHYINYISQ